MIIYISGPITGRRPAECEMKFNKAEREIRKRGHTPINPWKIGKLLPVTFEHEDYLEVDLTILKKCDGLLLLEGWQDSIGCRIEEEFVRNNDNKSVMNSFVYAIFYDYKEIPKI